MELTKEQTRKVEQFLESKNFDYIDLRAEILDHMISDIETITENKENDFDAAFTVVIKTWNNHLEDTSSWIFGVLYSAPKMVIDKAKKVFWKHYLTLMLIYFISFTLQVFLGFILGQKVEIAINTEFQFFCMLSIVICLVLFIYTLITKKNTVKTTFVFVLKTQSLSFLIGCFVLIAFFDNPEKLNLIDVGFFLCFVFSTFSYYYFAKKHEEAVKKYNVL